MAFETSRRDFNKQAALLGLGLATGAGSAGQVMAQATGGGSTAPGATAAGSGDLVPLAPPDRQPPDLKLPVAKTKAGWAIVGLGVLSVEEILPAFGSAERSKLVALVSGHPDKARQLAEVYGVDPAKIFDYDGFDRIADDPAIDAVYIVLPNSMHREFTERALRVGKHVLCEKPMAPTADDCRAMIEAARAAGRKLMIAYRLRYEPMNMKVIELCREGTYGPIRTFSASNCQTTEAPNIRLSKDLAGGPLGDIGLYCLNAARYVTGEEPVAVSGVEHRPADDPRFREVPASVSFTLRFPSGALAECDCSFDSGRKDRYSVQMDQGVVEMDPAFSYSGLRLSVKEGDPKAGDARRSELLLPAIDQFAAEMDHFSECILDGKEPRTPGEEGLADMIVIAAIEEAVRTGRWVEIGS